MMRNSRICILSIILLLPISIKGCLYVNRPCSSTTNLGQTCNSDRVYFHSGISPNKLCIDNSWQIVHQSTFSNCYEIKKDDNSAVDGYYQIVDTNGDNRITYCLDMGGSEGGFTRIYDVKNRVVSRSCLSANIPDVHIDYKKLYFIDKGNTVFDYYDGSSTAWTHSAFPTNALSLRFNTTDYNFTPIIHGRSFPGGHVGIPRTDIYDSVTTGRPCRHSNTHMPNICLSRFKMHIPDKKVKLTRISDLETLGNNCGDNKYIHNFYIYGGNCESQCNTCSTPNICLSCDLLCPTVNGGSSGTCVGNCDACLIQGKPSYKSSTEDKCFGIYIYIYTYII